VTLTDAGPLVALIDADEEDHGLCRQVLAQLELPLVTTWPAFTEAMYLLCRSRDPAGRQALWRLALSARLELVDLPPAAIQRAAKLMERYADLPMDLAEATLVALAEHRDLRRVFSLDRDFRVYSLHGRHHFEVLPGWN
jgi:predicted nucleic acid-binding protein